MSTELDKKKAIEDLRREELNSPARVAQRSLTPPCAAKNSARTSNKNQMNSTANTNQETSSLCSFDSIREALAGLSNDDVAIPNSEGRSLNASAEKPITTKTKDAVQKSTTAERDGTMPDARNDTIELATGAAPCGTNSPADDDAAKTDRRGIPDNDPTMDVD